MEKIKRFGRLFTQTAPFILSMTINLVPYFLYLDLSDGRLVYSILPFVIFYTLRMTGIFLLRGLGNHLDSYTLLILSLLLGGAGAIVGLFSLLYFPLYVVSAVLLGLGAAWFPAANATVNFQEQQQGFVNMHGAKHVTALCLFSVLFFCLQVENNLGHSLAFAFYSFLFICAYHTVKKYPHYDLDFKGLADQLISFKELIWFFAFFLLLFLLRSARILLDVQQLDLAVLLFCGLFVIGSWFLYHQKKQLRLPAWLNLLTFADGMCSNYVILFGTIYVNAYYGGSALATHLFLPYLIGTVAAFAGGSRLRNCTAGWRQGQLEICGLLAGAAAALIPGFFPAAVVLLAFFTQETSQFLTIEYGKSPALPEDQRILAKFATQNKGRIINQFFVFTVLFVLLLVNDLPKKELFWLTEGTVAAPAVLNVLELTKIIGGICLILLLIIAKKEAASCES